MQKQNDATAGVTQFFDITPEEFRRNYLNLKMSTLDRLRARSTTKKMVITKVKGNAPASWDWRDHGAVTPIKNQGMCGSCWAFSAMGNIEGQYQMRTKKTEIFSEQELVDCDTTDSGCNGGLMDNAFEYLENTGVMRSSDYPYTGQEGNCRFDRSKVVAKVTGYRYASGAQSGEVDEEDLKQFIYENGPLAIAVNANPFQSYYSGIMDPWSCDPSGLNHGVLLVGYGSENGTPYWIIKNSWGSSWGENGFIRIIGGKGTCGFNTFVVTADVVDA